MQVGLFATPRSYTALVRFSNGRGQDDTKPEVHAMAVKVLVPDGNGPPRIQDFIVADHPVFFARNVEHVFGFWPPRSRGRPWHSSPRQTIRSSPTFRASRAPACWR